MTTNVTEDVDPAEEIDLPRAHEKTRLRIVVLSALAGVLFTLALSNNYCCVAPGAAILTAFSVWLIDAILCATPIARRPTFPRGRCAIALVIPVLLAVSPLIRLSRQHAFELAFGMAEQVVAVGGLYEERGARQGSLLADPRAGGPEVRPVPPAGPAIPDLESQSPDPAHRRAHS